MDHDFAVTLDAGTSLANHTGSWRTVRPDYLHRLPPCNHACPAGEDIQGWLSHAEAGDYEAAWRALTENNPLPAVMGRVCYQPCESACNRAGIDSAVGINSVERFLGDMAIAKGWRFTPPAQKSGNKVLIVGAGPAGLSAAYHLGRLGHEAVIKEAGPAPGGMMRFGIPKYRLPRDILDAEVARLVELGVAIDYNVKVSDLRATMEQGRFDAAFLAVGAHIAKRAYIPAGEAARVLDAVQVLRSMEGEDKPLLGRRVVVYGGGNTAIDVARTARRLGAEEAVIVYRRTREKMPAHDFELEEALEEGVMMKWLSTIKNVEAGAITVEKMILDDKGFPQPTGEVETLQADSVILALGQDVDLSMLDGVEGLAIQGRRRAGRAQHDDRRAGRFRGRRYGAVRTHSDGGGRPRQEGRAPHRRLASGRDLRSARRSTRSPPSTSSTPGITARRRKPCARRWRSRAVPRPSRKWSRGSTKAMRFMRRGGACPAAIASSATIAMASARTMR